MIYSHLDIKHNSWWYHLKKGVTDIVTPFLIMLSVQKDMPDMNPASTAICTVS